MTLGGLALAVGILVDDATVTIENINRHMEELGEDILTAITRGAQEIMPPATVALFCICIAFVPLLALGGVAGYLFRPLAMAVVFAMIASYILTYTLVPTMAHFLLRNQHRHSRAGRVRRAAPHRVFRPPSSAASRHYFERLRQGYLGCCNLALQRRFVFAGGFLGVALLSLGLAPFLGQDFFPSVDAGAIKIHLRAPTGTRIEETTRLADQVEQKIRTIIPPDRLASIVDNIGLPISGINISYGNTGTIGVFDADMLVTLHDGATPTRRLCEDAARATAEGVSGRDVLLPARRYRQPDPQFRLARADRRPDRRRRSQGQPRLRQPSCWRKSAMFPASPIRASRSVPETPGSRSTSTANSPASSGSPRTTPRPASRRRSRAAPRRRRPIGSTPPNGVSYAVSVQTPQYGIDTLGDLKNLPLTAAQSTQLLGGLATFSPEPLDAIVSHYDIRNTVNIYATTQDRDLGGVAADIQKIVDDSPRRSSQGSTVTIRGQVATMPSAYQQLLIGLAFSIVLIYLLIVVNFQSWLDPFVIITALPAALAGIVWMLFLTHTTLSVPALTGAIMCMGVATANSILVVSFAREQLAEGKDAVEAALAAGATRFRPVLMTALAMIIGMAPMAIEPGQNSPLGRAVIGGLLFATFATLLFVPTVFSIAHRRQPSKAKRRRAARRPAFSRLIRSPHVLSIARHSAENAPCCRACRLRSRDRRRRPCRFRHHRSRQEQAGGRGLDQRPDRPDRARRAARARIRRTGTDSAGQRRRVHHRLPLCARERLYHRLEQGHRRPRDEGRDPGDDLGARSRSAARTSRRDSWSSCRRRSSRRRPTPISAT